ncbi:zinc finger and SCAN domain-containing protein 29-like [Gopherus flavomarginatus]|uniref:zinc finger and SCAN domain-containing protein 29-like n=1 Tax=Gopherus flavomarginatus TaxID=286002 RepID=UPI0021CC086B|nr:zinc finger and SCAN domain-containing protein 29-like [Gopherus flavomarginatus]
MQSPENRKRAPAWSTQELLDLIAVWGEESVLSELRSSRRNEKTFEKISNAMRERGHTRDSLQCQVKVKELRQVYQKTKAAKGRSGSAPKTCRFYDELNVILGNSATTNPSLSVDSEVGVVIPATTEDLFDGDDQYDEDQEEEAPAESTEHFIPPNSQDLFLTLTEVPCQPSQGSTPENEAEGPSSAAHFSSLLLASPLRSHPFRGEFYKKSLHSQNESLDFSESSKSYLGEKERSNAEPGYHNVYVMKYVQCLLWTR